MSKDKKDNKHVLYHYTDEESAKKIIKAGHIKASTDTKKDVRYGEGVYGTGIEPNMPTKVIAKNNYDDGPKVYERKKNKVEVAFECHVPKDNVKIVNDSHGRDIVVHKGNIPMSNVKKIHDRKADRK